ncbi:MAG: hypothetical protein BWK79_01940 [Beggiatoa sp. IS2]|nr:MAG: hypothetical protein BWK79_01940 [Beggiatoa sp. IS2]
MKPNIAKIEDYFNNISKANTEAAKKELFHTLLTRLFSHDTEIVAIVDKMNLGAEKTIFNIPLKDRFKTGRVDTQYNQVIIEWEKNLNKTGEHAKEQLTEYLSGNWHSGERYPFTLIATDGLQWCIYALDYGTSFSLENAMVSQIRLLQTDSFTLILNNFAEFPFFIDRYLFKSEPQHPTLENIRRDFGETSAVFINAMRVMQTYLPILDQQSELRTAYEQWYKFLRIAYGKLAESQKSVFFVHTYLSIFAKLLAYTVIATHQSYLEENQLRDILTGDIFRQSNVERFVENDFYYWVTLDEHFKTLKPIFREIAQKLSEYDFSEVQEDILKGVYQELIDLETRHALGEYYTPDWLCEKIIDSLPLEETSKILDPACGSGSFLRAAIAQLRVKFPTLTATQLTSQVTGIDIHPLSVQIAKTTLLLALSSQIRVAKKPITLQVYLANSLLLPEGTAGLFEADFRILIDDQVYSLNLDIFDNPTEFDEVISFCNHIADYSSQLVERKQFDQQLRYKFTNQNIRNNTNGLYRIYQALKEAKDNGRDSIWQFILQNSYKPVFLKNQFDFIIGNPPWLTYANVTNVTYQEELRILAQNYALIPKNNANMPSLEIAAIFLAHGANYFLKSKGKLAFVLPRSFLTADQHDNTRSGQAKGFQLTEIWDLDKVSPLFRVPATVVFVTQSSAKEPQQRAISAQGIQGVSMSGQLKATHLRWSQIQKLLEFKEITWFYSLLSKSARKPRSALTTTESIHHTQESYYFPFFKQGATIIPRNFYFIEPERGQFVDFHDLSGRILQVKTSESIRREAKMPWKTLILAGRINTHFLFYTALAKNIVPFALINPPLVLLPIVIKEDTGKAIKLKTADELFERGELEMATWFKKAEKRWDDNKTDNNRKNEVSLSTYLNWQNKLIQQNLNKHYLVLYTASAQDANAVVVDRANFSLEFIADSTTYWLATDHLNEAYYLTCFLNCGYTNQLIKEFQARGLFGARHVHKKILELPFPKFDDRNESHCQLAELGRQCALKAKSGVGDDRDLDLTPHKLGYLRKTVRQALSQELKKIDLLVEEISKNG